MKGGTLLKWLSALVAAAALFFGGLVLSHFVWNTMNRKLPPCTSPVQDKAELAAQNFESIKNLLSTRAPELELSLQHLLPFPFDYACVIVPGTSRSNIRNALGTLWTCSGTWARQVSSRDAYTSILAVSGDKIIPVRLTRSEFDFAESFPARIPPDASLTLRKRPGSDQILIRPRLAEK